MTRRSVTVAAAVWLVLSAAGLMLDAVALTVVAPVLAIATAGALWVRAGATIADPLEPIWPLLLLFGFAYVLVPPLAAIAPQTFATLPGYHDTPPAQHLFACWIGALAFAAIVAGYRSTFGRRLGRRLAGGGAEEPAVAAGALGCGLLVLGMASVAYAVSVSGVTPTPRTLFGGDLRAGVVAGLSGRGYLSVGFTMLMLAGPCVTLWAADAPSRRRWVLAGLASLCAIVALAGLTGSRIGVVAVCAGVLAVVHYRVRTLPTRLVVALAVALAAVGVAQAALRGDISGDGLLSPLGTLAGTLDGFAFLIDALARVREFEWGRTLLEDLGLTYVPRAIWEDKPTVFGFVRAQEAVVPGLFRDFSNGTATFPVGLVAEGYVNFAVFGAIALPLIAGALVRSVYVAFRRSQSAFWLLLLAWTLPNLISLMRGFATTLLTILLGALLLSPLLLRRRARQTIGSGTGVAGTG